MLHAENPSDEVPLDPGEQEYQQGRASAAKGDWQTAIANYRAAASKDNADACLALGCTFYSPPRELGEADYSMASTYLQKARTLGNREADYFLGVILMSGGNGLDRDYEHATLCLERFVTFLSGLSPSDMETTGLLGPRGLSDAIFRLGYIHEMKDQVVRAVQYYKLAVELDDGDAMLRLGGMYMTGRGVVEDPAEGYKWILLAAARGAMHAQEIRMRCISGPDKMTDANIAEGRRRAQLYEREQEEAARKTVEADENTASPRRMTTLPESRFQTGFCISSNGHVVTCAHGIENATNISVRVRDWAQARVLAVDTRNDIAILKVEARTAPIPIQRRMPRQGDDITVWGFPNPELQGENLKATKGSINSLTGIQDDIRLLQLDAAVQPGNSGSPVVSVDGRAVGMVISRLDDIVTLALTATLPQNVNYAIKSAYIMPVIQSAGIVLPSSVQPFESNDASQSVVLIQILSQPKETVSR